MDEASFLRRKLSIWEDQTWGGTYDLAIIGGGLVGLQAALYFTDRRPAARVIVLERDDPPAGASTRNAGFACVGSLGELAEDIDAIGFEATMKLVARRLRGLELLEARVGARSLKLDRLGNIEWFRSNESARFKGACKDLPKVNAALRMRLQLSQNPFVLVPDFQRQTSLPGAGAILNRLEGQLDPGAMVATLQQQAAARGVRSKRARVVGYEGSSGEFVVLLDQAEPITARGLVLATNAFTSSLTPANTTTSIRPALNQVIVTEPVPGLRWTLPMHLDRGYGYVRRIGDRILVGGFRHRAGFKAQTDKFGLDADVGEHLRAVMQELLPPHQSQKIRVPRIDYEWSGVLGLGPTRNPQVMRTTEGAIIAAGLGGMGVALGSALAHDAVSLLLDQ